MKATTGHKTKRKTIRALPALAAAGSVCALAGSAQALELGDVTIESVLGQPLRASIPYALNADEQLYDYCIALRPGVLTEGVPTISRPRITVADGRITLVGNTPILEPVMAMQVSVDCPYTARLAREYILMINPAVTNTYADAQPVPELEERAQPTPVAATVSATAPQAATTPASVSKPTPTLTENSTENEQSVPATDASPQEPIQMNSRYFVQAGDSLSSIARRIEDRPVGLWPAANAIYAANPEAFVGGDQNQLNASIWIEIPDLSGDYVAVTPTDSVATTTSDAVDETAGASFSEPVNESASQVDEADSGSNGEVETPVPAVQEASAQDQPAADATATNAPGEASTDSQTAETLQAAETADVEQPADDPTIAESPVSDATASTAAPDAGAAEPVAAVDTASTGDAASIVDDTDVLRPGDIVPEATEAPEAAPPVVRTAPVVSSGSVAASDAGGIPKWMMLAAGSLLALLLAAFAFGRQIREFVASRRTSEPALPDAEFDDDEPTTEAKIIDDVDFQFDENTLNSQALSLDADLGEGTGLQDANDLDVAQDFGFSATATDDGSAEVDLELPPEATVEPIDAPTDIIAPAHRPEEALVATITPAAEDTQTTEALDGGEDYDLSMIVDATKQEIASDELTAKDLHAVPLDAVSVEAAPAPQDIGNQTLTSEADIAILEQDYEDEFTQTQALNEEIARAAEELALRMDEDDTASVTSKLEEVPDPAMTATVDASLTAMNDDDPTELASLDDTGINPQVTATIQNPGAEPTVEMPPPGADPTIEMSQPGSDATVEMPNPGSDPTVDMANPGNDPTIEVEPGEIADKKPQAS